MDRQLKYERGGAASGLSVSGDLAVGDLVALFRSRAPAFDGDLDLSDIDNKHTGILFAAYKKFAEQDGVTWANFRNWGGQSDLGVPAQLSAKLIRANGLSKPLLRYFYRKVFWRLQDRFVLSSLLDDINVLSMIGAKSLMRENPVHLTPGATIFYEVDGVTCNQRWLRYIYLLKRILDSKALEPSGVWVDVGSYYGGLQGLVKKYLPKSRIVLVDFHHQLCRSFVYLSSLFPDVKHIMPDEVQDFRDFDNLPTGSFMYVPVGDFNKIEHNTASLVSNFFSLGEMRRPHFSGYMSSKLFLESELVYLVNRFVSTPFFEKTYDSDVTLLDYIQSQRDVKYFDVFPMHHYQIVDREVLGRKSYRNISSPYFEMVTSRHAARSL